MVARIGKEKVTFDELQKSLLLNPQYSTKSSLRQARVSQLKYLIEKRYYYLAAEKKDLADEPDIPPKLKYIREQETLRAFIQQKFLETTSVDETELVQGVVRLNKKLEIHQLFVTSQEEADQLSRRLNRGESFDGLAKEIYAHRADTLENGDIGTITFGQIEPALEDAVYQLQVGQVSRPIASKHGFHIFKVISIKDNVQAQNLSSATRTAMVEKIIKQRKADRKIRDFLEKLSQGAKIQINNKLLDVLNSECSRVTGEKYREPSLFSSPITTGELNSIRIGIKDVLDEPLVRFAGKEMKVAEFLQRLKEMPPYHRPYLRGRNRLAQSIIDLIRNDLLLKEAYRENFQKSETVKKNIAKERKELLANEFGSRINSPGFKKKYPGKWSRFNTAFRDLKKGNPAKIQEENLFPEVADPDSVKMATPIHLFLKNRYVW